MGRLGQQVMTATQKVARKIVSLL